MSKRFFVDTADFRPASRASRPGSPSPGACDACRTGDEIALFDGTGREFRASIERIGRSEIEASILEVQVVDRELPCPRDARRRAAQGDRQAWLVEKAVELGVTRLVPVPDRRGVAQPVDKAFERLRRA